MKSLNKKSIVIRVIVLGIAVAIMPVVMFGFDARKEVVASEERVLRTAQAGIYEVSDYIKSGITTRAESFAINSSKTALDVDARLAGLGEAGAGLRKDFEDYFVAMVAVNSIFLENRVTEGEARLDQLKKHAQRIDQAIQARISAVNTERERIVNIGRTAQIGVLLLIVAALLLVITACLPSMPEKQP